MSLTILDGPLRSCFTLELRHKAIGRLPELETVNSPEQGDLRLITEVIVHNGMCSKLINAVAQTLAYNETLKMPKYILNCFSIKLFCRLDD